MSDAEIGLQEHGGLRWAAARIAAIAFVSGCWGAPDARAACEARVAHAGMSAAPPASLYQIRRQEQEVFEALTLWSQAWSSKDLPSYFSFYSPAFVPDGNESRADWQKRRSERIAGKSRIKLGISDLTIRVEWPCAVVLFSQTYQSGKLNLISRKLLAFAKNGDRWLIVREASVP